MLEKQIFDIIDNNCELDAISYLLRSAINKMQKLKEENSKYEACLCAAGSLCINAVKKDANNVNEELYQEEKK